MMSVVPPWFSPFQIVMPATVEGRTTSPAVAVVWIALSWQPAKFA
jgi:hypothetical protein